MKYLKKIAQWEVTSLMQEDFGASSKRAEKCALEMYTPAEAATFAGTMTGLQDAGELLTPAEDGFGISLETWYSTVLKKASLMLVYFVLSDQQQAHIRICCEMISRCEVKDHSHSTSCSSIVARSRRMNMYVFVIGID